MEVTLKEFSKAKKGDILVYDGKYWQPQKSDELTKSIERRVDDLERLNEGYAEKERIKLEQANAKHERSNLLISFLMIENKIAKGELNEPDNYHSFVEMVESYQLGGSWDSNAIPIELAEYFK